MTGEEDDTNPFDDVIVERVAESHDIDATELRELVERHQSAVAAFPGVENLAYEWRKQYDAPVIARTPDAYYLSVPGWVWEEFGDHLGVDGDELDALAEVHREVGAVEEHDMDASTSERTVVVLDRSAGES